MKRKGHNTSFYVEMLLIIAAMTVVALILTHVFALSRRESVSAKNLTDAVSLAENGAEAAAASRTPEELLKRLDEGGNASFVDGAGVTTVRATYDKNCAPSSDGETSLLVTWEPEKAGDGELVRCTVTVLGANGQEVYSINTAVFVKEVDK